MGHVVVLLVQYWYRGCVCVGGSVLLWAQVTGNLRRHRSGSVHGFTFCPGHGSDWQANQTVLLVASDLWGLTERARACAFIDTSSWL